MSCRNHLDIAKSWPFEEARKIIGRLGAVPGKDCVILETGYGPSGLPHIGTFGEVLRTTFVMQAFRKLSDIPAKLFVFSDDMDGLRKVPTNVPNREQLEANLERPLTSIPDPFGQYESFAHHNNAMLRRFLDSFGFKYEFKSSTEMYKSGAFNECLSKILEHYDEIMSVMLPSLREERQRTYCPFLPICPRTGKVLQVPIIETHLDSRTIVYADPETGNLEEVSVLDGHCKLQWKADWGMRWVAFGVDYEMNGKDLIDSFKLSSKICNIIGGRPPENLTYELFLDEDGKKISKSKGNGISMDEWLKYSPHESLAYYMYQSPKRAKRLYFDVIPSAMDDYIDSIEAFHKSENTGENPDSPVFHIHDGNPPHLSNCPKFSMLLNLVQACSTADENVLMEFVKKYIADGSGSSETMDFTKKMVKFAVTYYEDFVANTRKFIVPDDLQRRAITELRDELEELDHHASADDFQTKVFEVGKRFFEDDIRSWFKTLYGFLFGSESGPKMGSFIHLYGVGNTVNLMNKELANGE
ncbi:MAG: lysine--tRNA ligase [Holosporales bacterium]|jgi:lysyl-tRNA synthetase class 1|nr:lysine--tRNA ligase [Holosporales bacterium]